MSLSISKMPLVPGDTDFGKKYACYNKGFPCKDIHSTAASFRGKELTSIVSRIFGRIAGLFPNFMFVTIKESKGSEKCFLVDKNSYSKHFEGISGVRKIEQFFGETLKLYEKKKQS